MSTARLIETRGEAVSCGDVAGGRVERTEVKVKNVGVHTMVRTNCFSMTNHMLRQIENYLPPGVSVYQFPFFPHLQWIMVTTFCISYFSIFSWVFNIISIVVVINFFIIICQYVYICYRDVPWLFLVPVVEGLPSLNSHMELDINHIEGMYLRAKEVGLFRGVAVSGKEKFLVMSPKMLEYIKQSRVFTAFLFAFCLVTLVILWVFLIITVHYPVLTD